MTNEWVSVKHRLPLRDGLYLIFSSGYTYKDAVLKNGVDVDYYRAEDRRAIWLNIRNGGNFGITHWMTLPEPPEELTDAGCKE